MTRNSRIAARNCSRVVRQSVRVAEGCGQQPHGHDPTQRHADPQPERARRPGAAALGHLARLVGHLEAGDRILPVPRERGSVGGPELRRQLERGAELGARGRRPRRRARAGIRPNSRALMRTPTRVERRRDPELMLGVERAGIPGVHAVDGSRPPRRLGARAEADRVHVAHGVAEATDRVVRESAVPRDAAGDDGIAELQQDRRAAAEDQAAFARRSRDSSGGACSIVAPVTVSCGVEFSLAQVS